MNQVLAVEDWWLSQYSDVYKLIEKRKLQARAFRMAEEQAELNQAPRKKQRYIPGEMCKCPECNYWVHKDTCKKVFEDHSGSQWFRNARFYNSQLSVLVCERCSINCAQCGSLFPLENALRYGLCVDCNTLK